MSLFNALLMKSLEMLLDHELQHTILKLLKICKDTVVLTV